MPIFFTSSLFHEASSDSIIPCLCWLSISSAEVICFYAYFFSQAILKPLLLQKYITESPLIHSINSSLSATFSIFAQHLFKRLRPILFKRYSQLSITLTLMRARGLLGTKTKAARDSVSFSYRIGFSIGNLRTVICRLRVQISIMLTV